MSGMRFLGHRVLNIRPSDLNATVSSSLYLASLEKINQWMCNKKSVYICYVVTFIFWLTTKSVTIISRCIAKKTLTKMPSTDTAPQTVHKYGYLWTPCYYIIPALLLLSLLLSVFLDLHMHTETDNTSKNLHKIARTI